MLLTLVILAVFSPTKPLAIMGTGSVANVLSPTDTVTTDYLNIRINSVTTNIQNEEQIVINPRDSLNMVAVWRDFRLGYRQVGVGYTLDGGNTWHDTLFAGTPYAWDSDPAITVDDSGNFYAVVLSLPSDASTSGIFVFKSSDGGVSWQGPYTVVDAHTSAFEDKEWITCDASPYSPYRGNLYVAWTRFYDYTNGGIDFTRSTDGGETWSQFVRLSSETYGVQWPVLTVDDSGVVYVAWMNYYMSRLEMTKSTDGGVTFSVPRTIIDLFDGGWYTINPDLVVISYPAIKADVNPQSPYIGNLYVVFMDSTAHNGTDIFFMKSTDGGNNWSTPMRLNDDIQGIVRDQFHPWIDVDQNGVITVIFYDRRNDPHNRLMDLYLTQSFDGGETWTPNVRVTSVSSDPAAGSKSGLIGEYIGLDTWNGKPFMVWTDTREGTQDVYFGKDTVTTNVVENPVRGMKIGLKSNVVKNSITLNEIPQHPPVLYSFDGRKVRVFHARRMNYRVTDLPPGVYFIKIDDTFTRFLKI